VSDFVRKDSSREALAEIAAIRRDCSWCFVLLLCCKIRVREPLAQFLDILKNRTFNLAAVAGTPGYQSFVPQPLAIAYGDCLKFPFPLLPSKNLSCWIFPPTRIPYGPHYGQLRLDPWWDPLRGDPRFEQVVASLAPKAANKQCNEFSASKPFSGAT
jgi:hypothetical protein